jgi:hypothetical protein
VVGEPRSKTRTTRLPDADFSNKRLAGVGRTSAQPKEPRRFIGHGTCKTSVILPVSRKRQGGIHVVVVVVREEGDGGNGADKQEPNSGVVPARNFG